MRRGNAVVSLRIVSLIAARVRKNRDSHEEWTPTLRATHQAVREQDLLLYVAREKSV